jgi:hypothetical protein
MVALKHNGVALSAVVTLLLGLGVAPAAAEPDPGPAPQENAVTALDSPVLPQAIEDVPALDPGPDGEVLVEQVPNAATQQVETLAALAPASGSPDVPMAAVEPEPAVGPGSVALPTRPVQELVDATAADALTTLDAAGRLSDGRPDLDAVDLQPQIATATPADASRIATRLELETALADVELSADLGVDPLAVLEALPDGIPRVTYRVCSESETRTVSCTMRLPLAVPAIVDATGDGTPDVLADLLPAASLDDVSLAAEELLDAQVLLDDAQSRLTNLLELMEDPAWLLLNPWALVEVLELRGLVEDLTETVAAKTEALLNVIHLGLAMLEVRLPTSEFAGEDLPAHVWAVYDIPGAKRLSVGFDGYRRGTSLSTATLGLFTFSPFSLLAGELDINAHLAQVGAGEAMAVTAGFSTVADTEEGEAVDPTVASAQFSPVPTLFSVDVEVKPATEEHDQTAIVESSSTTETRLDALVLANARTGEAPEDRFVQAVVDRVPTTVRAELTWTGAGDRADLAYEADSVISGLLFADFTYAGGTDLVQATRATAQDLPAQLDAALATEDSGSVTLDYVASSRMTGIDVAYFDLAGELVLRGGLDDIPTTVSLLADVASGRALFDAPGALGAAYVDASQGLGEYPPADGDHVTLVTDGADLGVSARVSGLERVDAYFDDHPRVTTAFAPGGQSFDAAGNLDGVHRARAHISNLPADATIDVSTQAQQVRYTASSVIDRASMAYTNTQAGPSVTAVVHEVPASVALDYTLGEAPRVVYEASSEVPRVDFFASPHHVQDLDPTGDEYVSALIEDIPASIDVGMDFVAQHLEGTLSSTLGGIDLTARLPVGDRVWTAGADLEGVPTRFDADWADGTVRARALTGTMRSIDVFAANHADHVAPVGLRLAGTYHERTGNIDAAVATRNLTHVEYADNGEAQSFRLETDTEGDPVFVDVDALLTDANGADDTRLALLGRVDNLPATMDVVFTGDRLTYTADRRIGLTLEARLGKVAALDGLGAPLYDNGVAAVARACATGAGCAADDSPFCSEDRGCLAVVGTISMQGLPTEVTADLTARTVHLAGYRPPSDTLRAYVRLIGMIDALPDLRAEATLTGLPDELDLTVGPVTVGDGSIDAGYTASAPLGALTLRAQADTTYDGFPHLRARGEVSGLPSSLAITSTIAERTVATMTSSAPVDRIGLVVTGADEGYLDAALTDVPARAEVVVDTPAARATGTASAPLGGVTVLANNLPYQGDEWAAWLDIQGIPAGFEVAWGEGQFGFRSTAGALTRATAAVTNHAGARAPDDSHLAFHYDEASGRVDASVSAAGIEQATYSRSGPDQEAELRMAEQDVVLDGNLVLVAGGVADTQLALSGILHAPNTVLLTIAEGKFSYTADTNTGLLLQAEGGKVAALENLADRGKRGAPLFDNGVAARATTCTDGPGCSTDVAPELCDAVDGCLGAVMNLNLQGLPTTVTVDAARQTVDIGGLRNPGRQLQVYAEAFGVIPGVPRAEALLDLSEMPDNLDVTVGPSRFGAGADGREIELGYSASDTIGALDARVEADTTDYGEMRGQVTIGAVPQSTNLLVAVGEETTVTTTLSGPLDSLEIRATAVNVLGEGSNGSAFLQLTDVPAVTAMTISGFDAGDDFAAPTLRYTGRDAQGADVSTLDGLVEVEAALIQGIPVGEPLPLTGNAAIEFTDLGATSSAALEQNGALALESQPSTGELAVHVKVETGIQLSFDEERIWEDRCDPSTALVMDGHLNLPTVRADLRLVADSITQLVIMPDKTGTWAALGVEGDYGSLTTDFSEILIVPDIDLDLTYERDWIPDVTVGLEIGPEDAVDGVLLHVSDNDRRTLAGVVEVLNVPVPVFTTPGRLRAERNHAVLYGADGQQMLSYWHLDPFPLDWEHDTISVLIHTVNQYALNPFAPDEPEEPCE